jgi:hypothetical protein
MSESSQSRRAAEVQGQGKTFILEQQTTMTRRCLAQLRPDRIERFGGKWVRVNMAGGVATLEAMLARRGKLHARKEAVDVGERAPADQRDRTAALREQVGNEPTKVAIRLDIRWRLREIDEGAVDVEEVGPFDSRRRQGP